VNETLLHELKIERTQNSRLQLKICEMEKFLADYGLVWVGSSREREQGLSSYMRSSDNNMMMIW
jgi:hypothetical protein